MYDIENINDKDKWNELVSKVTTLENESSSVLQTHIFSDYTRRSTAN